MEYHLILNPVAGRGKAGKLAPHIISRLEQFFPGAAVHRTEYPGHAREIAATLCGKEHILLIAGGDGTIHEVVNGVLPESKVRLGFIPIGSGNDFVKMFDIPADPDQAIDVIRRGETMQIDVGKVGDEFFPNGLGIGFDADVVIQSLKIKHLRGFLIYFYAVLRTLLSYRNRPVKIQGEGVNVDGRVLLVSIGNGRCQGGGFHLTPRAKIDDGQLDICIFHALSFWEILVNLPKAIPGKHLHLPQVQTFRARDLHIESEQGFPAHADGELLGTDLHQLDISIVPGALTVIHNLNHAKH